MSDTSKVENLTQLEQRVEKIIDNQREWRESQDKLFEGQALVLDKLTDINKCLLGDDYHPNGGLIKQVKCTQTEIENIKRRQTKLLTWGATLWAFLTGLGIFIVELIVRRNTE